MTIAEKLRFLADRTEDGKEFYIMYSENKIRTDYEEFTKDYDIQELEVITLSLKPQWEFTEDEKVILRNLPDNYQWIARDESNRLFVYDAKPVKASSLWWEDISMTNNLIFGEVLFKHLFQSIQWSDKEPCEFRKYLEVTEV